VTARAEPELGRAATRGALGSTAIQLATRALTLASTLLLTHYLAPAEQGEVNVAYVLVATASSLGALGVQPFLVTRPTLDRSVTFHATLALATSQLVSLGLLLLTGSAVASALGAPEASAFLPWFALSQLLDRLVTVPRALLARSLSFAAVGVRVSIAELVYCGVALALARAGWGGYAILAGNLARSAVAVGLFCTRVDPREYLTPSPLRPSTFREVFAYGLPLGLGAALHLASASWDNLVMHALFGPAALGLYNQAYRLADVPATQLSEPIGDVLAPTLARVSDPAARRDLLTRGLRLAGFVVFPASLGLGAVASTLVEALFPAPYAGVATYLAALSVLGIAKPVSVVALGHLQVAGRTTTFAALDALKLASVLVAMIALAPLGPTACALGVGAGYGLNALLMLASTRRDGCSPWALARALGGPLLACIPLLACVFGVRTALASMDWSAPTRLAVEVASGAFGYALGALLLAPSAVAEITGLVGRIRARQGSPDPGGA
jgi:lipopolysaccharide exporter